MQEGIVLYLKASSMKSKILIALFREYRLGYFFLNLYFISIKFGLTKEFMYC